MLPLRKPKRRGKKRRGSCPGCVPHTRSTQDSSPELFKEGRKNKKKGGPKTALLHVGEKIEGSYFFLIVPEPEREPADPPADPREEEGADEPLGIERDIDPLEIEPRLGEELGDDDNPFSPEKNR